MKTLAILALTIATLVSTQALAQSGGVGTGGGMRILSSAEEIRQTVRQILSDLGENNPERNPLTTALVPAGRAKNERVRKMLMRIRYPFIGTDWRQQLDGKKPLPPLSPADYLKLSRLEFPENDLCHGVGEAHTSAEASVSKFSYGADMCFSIKALISTPRGTTHQTLLALVVHEVAHLNGYDESEAGELQTFFIDHYREIMKQDDEWRRYRFVTISMSIEMSIFNAHSTASLAHSGNSLFLLGSAHGQIQSMIETLPHPEYYDRVRIARPQDHAVTEALLRKAEKQAHQLASLLSDKLRADSRVSNEEVESRFVQLKKTFREAQDKVQMYLFGELRIQRPSEK